MPTPFQEAKANKEAYIKLVIDERYSETANPKGRVIIEGAVSDYTIELARKLLEQMMRDEPLMPIIEEEA